MNIFDQVKMQKDEMYDEFNKGEVQYACALILRNTFKVSKETADKATEQDLEALAERMKNSIKQMLFGDIMINIQKLEEILAEQEIRPQDTKLVADLLAQIKHACEGER